MNQIFVHLPRELSSHLEDIRLARKEQLLPTTNRAIVVEAIKAYHKKVVSNGRS